MRKRKFWLALVLSTIAFLCIALWGISLISGLFPQPWPVQYARWVLMAPRYKRDVLAQSGSNQDLKHVEWDGWGWAGMDTTVYLVFDPDNALAKAAISGSAGSYPRLPCEVHRVRRLEPSWYTVQFYTDTDWNHCSANQRISGE